jgi:hypothetical protein
MLFSNQHLIPMFFFISVWSAFVGIVLERLIYAGVFFTCSSILAAGNGAASIKRFASMEVLKEGISGTFDSVVGALQAVAMFSVNLLSNWLFIL